MTALLTHNQPTVTDQPSRPDTESVRVCHVSTTLCTGGLERLLVDFARFHDRDRYRQEFVAMDSLGQPADDIRDAGCPVTAMDSVRCNRRTRIRRLAELFVQRHIDVVHTHNAYPHLYATLAARWARVPVVVHTRHGRRFGGTVSERLMFGFAGRLTNRVVAVSDDTAALCRRLGRLDPDRVMRIWNGVDVDRFGYHGPTSAPVAISVARLSAEKDFPTLLKAVALVVGRVPEFRLLLVGDGPERPRLERLAGMLRLDDRVCFLGERSDVPDLLAEAGFFVSSSLTEGISLTLLEAMAVGLPVVATDVVGNGEIVRPGETGRLVPAANPSALAEQILWMCDHPEHRPHMGEQSRRRVEQYFNVRTMVRDYEQLYAGLLSDRSRRSVSRT